MKRAGAMLALVAGLILASAGGVQQGEQVAAARRALDAGEEAVLPGPAARLAGWFSTGGLTWAAGVVLIVGGAALARREMALEAGGEGESHVGRADFAGTVVTLRTEAQRLADTLVGRLDDDEAPEVRDALDGLRLEVIGPLVEARGQLMARHGLEGFALYFSPFSAGERQLNRAWSALTDGHTPTARQALADAVGSFGLALAAWEEAEAGRATG